MDRTAVQRLKSCFNQLAPRGPELMDRFYAHLFSEHPHLRPMFPKNMAEQKQMQLASLMLVVKHLATPERLRSPLLELGCRHVEYGAKTEHDPIVRDTLVAVIGEMAGEAWSPQLESDWKGAIDFVASIMIEGATTPADPAARR